MRALRQQAFSPSGLTCSASEQARNKCQEAQVRESQSRSHTQSQLCKDRLRGKKEQNSD
jgi:hypothetical protein